MSLSYLFGATGELLPAPARMTHPPPPSLDGWPWSRLDRAAVGTCLKVTPPLPPEQPPTPRTPPPPERKRLYITESRHCTGRVRTPLAMTRKAPEWCGNKVTFAQPEFAYYSCRRCFCYNSICNIQICSTTKQKSGNTPNFFFYRVFCFIRYY